MFQYISDIHLEYLNKIPDDVCFVKTADNLLLLGDIGHPGSILYTKFINNCSKKYKNIILIYGNHENYSVLNGKNKNIETIEGRLLHTVDFPKNVFFLNNSCLFFDKVKQIVKLNLDNNDNESEFIKIIGSTLWTDCVYNISCDNNYKHIFVDNNKLIDYEYQSKLFNESKNYILKEIDNHKNIKCILLTHYSTHTLCNDIYIDTKDHNHITELFTKQNLLACINGHTHVSINKFATGTSIKLLANCYGHKQENTNYNPHSVLNINDVSAISFYGIYATRINYQEIFNSIRDKSNSLNLGYISESESSYIIADSRLKKENVILYASDKFTQLTGYSSEEIIGRNCRFLQSNKNKGVVKGSFRLDCDDTLVYNIKQNIIKKEQQQYVIRNYKKNKESFINLLTIIPIVYNKIEYIIGLQKDVTDFIYNYSYDNLINDVNIKLRNNMCIDILLDIYLKTYTNNECDSTLIPNSSYMLLITDTLGNIKHANDEFIKKIEYDEDEICNTNIKDYMNPDNYIDLNTNINTTRFITKQNNSLNFILKIKRQHEMLFYIIYDITKPNKDSKIMNIITTEYINNHI